MELSREVYSLIVRHVASRADLLSLCLVSKRYRQEAQRALFNTLHLRGYPRILDVCRLLSATPRLSRLVDALSLFLADERPCSSDSGSDDESESDSEDGCTPAGPPHGFWPAVAAALRGLDKLRFLSVYFEQAAGSAQAWVLAGSRFRLRTFHCEFDWDAHLVAFLRTQPDLVDLYLADYRKHIALDVPRARADVPPPPRALPQLAVLECTFGEAAAALVPGRPLARVKTCFSRSGADAKRGELRELLARLRASRRALCALDLADEAYTEDFSLELLAAMGSAVARFAELRYLGTLVLPVDGRKVRCPAPVPCLAS
ncbi:hypothetical protein PsYK624_086670 [Phanerochaete sordida]|uniref:F-box domain-containing protein n=1 Tax=Phanerochaete sordida TaxID=48140 RepID=A0A9P3GCS7_9APHY|nr:hypothetical protein PsYK624_086670 [Phanerochaete sordida]